MSKPLVSTKGGGKESLAELSQGVSSHPKDGKAHTEGNVLTESKKTTSSPFDKRATELGRRSPIRSRIAVAQDNRLSSQKNKQEPTVGGGSLTNAPGGGEERPTQNRISCIRPLSQLETFGRSGVPHEGRFKVKKTGTLHKAVVSGKAASGDAPLDPPAFEEENHLNRAGSSLNPRTVADQPSRFGAAISASKPYGVHPAQQSANDERPPKQPLVPPLCQLAAEKERGCVSNAGASPIMDVATRISSIRKINQEPNVSPPSAGTKLRNSGETRNSGSRPSATRAGYVLDSHVSAGDAVTTDTRDSISRSRLSAQVLRGILGNNEKGPPGTLSRQLNTAGTPANRTGTSGVNPLHHVSRVSAASDSAENAELRAHDSYGYDERASFTQSSDAQISVRADDLDHYRNADGYDGDENFGDEESFTNRRGELEWLRTPSLFYFFANVIKWNELQLQRRTLLASWEAHQHDSNQESLSLISVWTQRRERELRTLEAHISFSAFELEGVYLNRLLMSWSVPRLRSLVADVVVTWKKEGPGSAKFDRVSSRLFDAISSEEACQLRCTWVFSLRQWLGLPQHRWIVAGVLIACFVVAILCIVFLAVFGRTHEAVCIVLSAVLGVAVILMYVLTMFILHHNTYASAAAIYFREAAVRAAQQKMEEEELEDADDESGIDSYLVPNEGKYGGTPGHGTHGLEDSDESDVRSDYTEEQMSLAVQNLRALTEGTAPPAGPGDPYYRIPSNPPGGRRESGTAAGGYYDDDMTLTDDNAPSLTSRPLHVGDAAKPKQDLDRDNTLLLSTVTYEQHQEYLKQRQSLLVQETMSLSKTRNDKVAETARKDHFAGHVDDKEKVNGSSGDMGNDTKRGGGGVDGSTRLRQLADLPDKVNITALIYCNNASVLSEVAPALWERMFMLLRVVNLRALDNAFKHGSERFKVILVHAPDAPDGSEVLRTALAWLQVERRPVFFVSRQPHSFAHQVPLSARLRVPLTSSAMNTLLLAGIGVEAELGSVSFPALLQQEQSPSQPFQVPPYVLGRRLGGGAFGNVFEAEMEDSGAKCAVKRMYLKEDSDDGGQEEHGGHSNTAVKASARTSTNEELRSANGATGHTTSSENVEAAGKTASNPDADADAGATGVGSQLREIAQEVEIMSSLQHPNIVRYYFCERDDNCISIFMELCTGGSLSSLIHSGKLVNPPEIKLLLREIVSAVAYLHSLRIVHRDLKPDNVLFRQGHAKITDFGTAVHKHGGDLRLIKGTFAYMAPETLVGEPYGSACDVWSIGCIAAEVLSVDLPQHALGLPAMCEYYRNMEKDSTLPIECSVPGVRDFLLACLRRDPSERSTAAELFYHPILQARNTSIHTWMQKVVEQRRHKHILQHKMSHRFAPGARGNGAPGSVHAGSTSVHGSNVVGTDGGDLFDLNSGNGSVISLDSSRLTGHEEQQDSLLTP
jgi:serine/threonine protein kinase